MERRCHLARSSEEIGLAVVEVAASSATEAGRVEEADNSVTIVTDGGGATAVVALVVIINNHNSPSRSRRAATYVDGSTRLVTEASSVEPPIVISPSLATRSWHHISFASSCSERATRSTRASGVINADV
jgi:hypothetical protein